MKKTHNNSGQKELFPETAHEDTGNLGIATSHIPAPHNTSSHCPGGSSDKLSSSEHDSAPLNEIANPDLNDKSEQPVDSHEAVPQTSSSDFIPSLADAGDSHVHCEPPNTATTPSENHHDCAGGEPPVSEPSDRIAGSATGPSPAPHHHDEVLVDGDKVAPGAPPNDSASLGVCPNRSHEPNSIPTSEAVEEGTTPLDGAATGTGRPTDPALPDVDDGQTVLEERTGAGVDEAGAVDVPMGEQSQTTGAFAEVGDSEQGGESKQTEEGVTAPVQHPVVPTSPTSKQSGRRKLHPQVIVNERDTLNKSERAILDRLKELNRKQIELLPNSPPDEVEAGYADLKTTGATCTKTVQRTIRKLTKKGFLDRVRKGNQAGSGSRAKYRIVPEDEVKRRRLEKGHTHWVQVGSGRKAVPDPEESEEHDD